jgi:hypothetical protein
MSPTPAKARRTGSPEAREVERRLHCRYPITLDVEYKWLTADCVERIGLGKTVNVSSGGVLFEAKGALPAGSLVEVLMDWPFKRKMPAR